MKKFMFIFISLLVINVCKGADADLYETPMWEQLGLSYESYDAILKEASPWELLGLSYAEYAASIQAQQEHEQATQMQPEEQTPIQEPAAVEVKVPERGTPYEMLGAAEDASSDKIKSAHRRLARKYHPDKGGDPEVFKRISMAFNLLNNAADLAEYNEYRNDDWKPPVFARVWPEAYWPE